MMNRILVAVDDSSPALAAATYAIELVQMHPAELRFASVEEPGREPEVILRHVVALAASAGVTATAVSCDGHRPFDAVLTIARQWQADLIIMGRSDMNRPGQRYVGSQTEHLLEFTEIPVLVVPAAERSAS